ncbi:MAG TPA: pyridoxamine 5'-phosphate oxidase family protein [Mycobacteriales bacterium]|jgi:nitroimidazol reductase NimA-like FMN-containing flavoprotein (pyridoxamine 5'-phosphate oxidase superfamily)|nr:pyridoxamine 5'-phosphate oxidase family protein [Mycobacteriales bacterium]
MAGTYPPTARTRPTRAPQRVAYDRAAVHAVLDEAVVSHVGFVVDGVPVVLPQLHARRGDRLYLHGSTGARALLAAREGGLPVCVTVTLLDGLVLARSAFHHSVNYRSVVVHGTAVAVDDEVEKSEALSVLVDAIAPGRTAGTRAPSRKELVATTVLRLDLLEVSVKVRTGPPVDEPADLDLPHWAGVLPLTTRVGAPQPAPDLAAGIAVPEHVAGWGRPGG